MKSNQIWLYRYFLPEINILCLRITSLTVVVIDTREITGNLTPCHMNLFKVPTVANLKYVGSYKGGSWVGRRQSCETVTTYYVPTFDKLLLLFRFRLRI
jgi:hypothetical protein